MSDGVGPTRLSLRQRQGAGNGGGQAGALGPGPGGAGIVPEADAAGLVAYLRLFTRVMRDGAPGAVAAWLHALEEAAGVAPLWEVFFQLMCHPVPQVTWRPVLAS